MEILFKYPRELFIDDNGIVFKYKKGKDWATLEYVPIKNVIYPEGQYPLIFIEGVTYPLSVGNYKNLSNSYVGLLTYHGGHLIYELTGGKKPGRKMRL